MGAEARIDLRPGMLFFLGTALIARFRQADCDRLFPALHFAPFPPARSLQSAFITVHFAFNVATGRFARTLASLFSPPVPPYEKSLLQVAKRAPRPRNFYV